MVLLPGLHYFQDEQIKVPVTRRSTAVSSGRNPDRLKAQVRAGAILKKPGVIQIFGKHAQVSLTHPEKQELFHLNSLAFTSFIFINCLFQSLFYTRDVSAVDARLIHLKGLPFIVEVQKRRNGVTDHIRDKKGQEKEIWNVFSTFKYSKIRSLGKNNGLFFSKAI